MALWNCDGKAGNAGVTYDQVQLGLQLFEGVLLLGWALLRGGVWPLLLLLRRRQLLLLLVSHSEARMGCDAV